MVPGGREVSEEPMEKGVGRQRMSAYNHPSQPSLIRNASSSKLRSILLSLNSEVHSSFGGFVSVTSVSRFHLFK